MKRIIQSATTLTAAIAFALSVQSCDGVNGNNIVGSGNVTKETRHIERSFDKVVAKRGLDVVVEQSSEASVVVEADDNLIRGIKTSVEGNTLVITSDYNSYTNVSSKKVTVKMPKISGLEAESGADLKSGGSLRSEKLELETSSGGHLQVVVEADNLNADSSSGSHLEIAGKALEFDASSSSGSEIVAAELLANEISAEASSGSHVLVHPLVELKGKASSGGAVRYMGDPRTVTKDESSGGSVSKED